jgi:transglutaminase-like putative cysteine protease
LVFLALLCAPLAMVGASDDLNSVRGSGALLVLTVLAGIVGLWFARSRLAASKAAILGALVGMGLVTITAGRLIPSPLLLWRELGYAADWFQQARTGDVGWPLPFATTLAFIWQRLDDLGTRLWWWSQGLTTSGPAREPIAFQLMILIMAWACALFATWQIYRHRAVLVGLLPSGLAIATTAFFRGGLAVFYLVAYLGSTLSLLAMVHLWVKREQWDQTGTDYPQELLLELIFALAPSLVLILSLASFFPVIHPEQVRDAFWKLAEGPWSAVEQTSERLFGPLKGTGLGRTGAAGTLPQLHLLGSGPELGQQIVFYVSTNDPPPPLPQPSEPEPIDLGYPRRYWRSSTYDTYTGRGWTNGQLEQRPLAPGESLAPGQSSGPELRQQFEVIVPKGNFVYAANAPLRVDEPVQSWWRAPGDLAQLTGAIDSYTVLSLPPDPSIADMELAPATLPPSVSERYLSLPETIPPRVLDLAREVAGQAETAYDRTQAIEFFLRTYTYTLDLPAPPAEQDLVDYFLFDLQEGYCDYYASAMVIMARAVGVPARLATGYAQGSYDHDLERWVVTEKDGHSWAEVYFDGIGWVEFEPTAGQPALVRAGADLSRPAVPPLPPRTRRTPQVPWALLVLGGVMALLAAVVVYLWWPQRGATGSAEEIARNHHARLVRWGTRLGHPLRDGQTPFEYGATLSNTLHSRGQDSRLPQARQASVDAPLEVEHLTEPFVRAQYSAEPLANREAAEIQDVWNRLRRSLWWLWLGRRR